jgi:hypothetical protein
MTRRAGSADLPLYAGGVPPWLAERMATLGAIITQAMVHHYGCEEFCGGCRIRSGSNRLAP